MEVGATFAGTHVQRSLGPAQLTSASDGNIVLEQQETGGQLHKHFRFCYTYRASCFLTTMSGLEVVGIVLGALPLIISALEHYTQGVTTAKRFWHFKSELRSLLTQIETETSLFVNTIEQLLEGIVRIEKMSELIANLGGEGWEDDTVEQRLKDRLRGSYRIYLENVQGMAGALQTIMKKLVLDPDGKVRQDRSFSTVALMGSLARSS